MDNTPNPNVPSGMTEDQVAQAIFALAVRECFELGLSPEAAARAQHRSVRCSLDETNADVLRGRVFRDWQKLMGKP